MDDDNALQPKPNSAVSKSAEIVAAQEYVVQFRGRPMIYTSDPFPHFKPLYKDRFEGIAYPLLGGVSRSRMGDVFAYLSKTAEDLSGYDRYVLFGIPPDEMVVDETTDLTMLYKQKFYKVWDTKQLAWAPEIPPDHCIWRSPYVPVPVDHNLPEGERPLKFIMDLAGGDTGVYDDIMQSLAPLIMDTKPDGVMWWVGDGANGKSTLMDAIYRIFPNQLASINVKRLADGRDTPSLNGVLANVVKESSEGRIEDTEIYKSIGTHENFRVHKFHSQDDVEIRGNLHHIFSANTIPSFNDKGYSARRRTFIVPFLQRFVSDPSFESKTFTPQFFGQLISELCRYARQIRRQGYRYKWSAVTSAAKADYDAEASNAEEYAKSIINDGVMAFENFSSVSMDYNNWCADMGYVPLGVSKLRRAMRVYGFERTSFGDYSRKIYMLPDVKQADLQSFGPQKPGMFSIAGFQKPLKPEVPDEIIEEPFKKEPEKPKVDQYKDVTGGKW